MIHYGTGRCKRIGKQKKSVAWETACGRLVSVILTNLDTSYYEPEPVSCKKCLEILMADGRDDLPEVTEFARQRNLLMAKNRLSASKRRKHLKAA